MQKVSRFIIEKIPRTRTNTQILSYTMRISIDSTNLAEFVFLTIIWPSHGQLWVILEGTASLIRC